MKAKTVSKCERCSKDAHLLEVCFTCGKKVCHNCEKSSRLSRKVQKGERKVICKGCWTTPSKRTKYKAD
ncbi:MAG: hypothetical protein WC792_05570 [Candidatus Micrarchaeia archaeon]|jgi:hypothetical protein